MKIKPSVVIVAGLAAAAALAAVPSFGQGAAGTPGSAPGPAATGTAAPPAESSKAEIKTVVGKNWRQIQPCIDAFSAGHPDEKFFIIRFEVEPGPKIAGVFTQPSDEKAAECFKGALSGMPMPQVQEETPLAFRIDLPEKIEPQPGPVPPGQGEEPAVEKAAAAAAPMVVPVGKGRMYLVGGEIMGPFKLKSYLIGFDASRALAKKSRANTGAGWTMQIVGPLLNIAGAILFSFGLNEVINDSPPVYYAKDWAKPFLISGALMLATGIAFDITGSILISRGWSYLAAAVKLYNASDPQVPILPAE